VLVFARLVALVWISEKQVEYLCTIQEDLTLSLIVVSLIAEEGYIFQ
jgi:hypothetical protein